MNTRTGRKHNQGEFIIRAVAWTVIAIEAVFLCGILLSPQRDRIRDLEAVQNGYELTVSWQKGGSGPWQVSVLWNGRTLIEQEAGQREASFQLAPGYDYTVRVNEESTDVSMREMPNYTGGDVSLENVKLCYYRIKENGKRGNELIDAKPETIHAPSIGAEGGRDYQISIFYEMSQGEETEALCFLLADGYQETRAVTFSPSDLPQFTDSIPLNDLLTAHGGGDNVSLKIYLGGCLLTQRTYTISAN